MQEIWFTATKAESMMRFFWRIFLSPRFRVKSEILISILMHKVGQIIGQRKSIYQLKLKTNLDYSETRHKLSFRWMVYTDGNWTKCYSNVDNWKWLITFKLCWLKWFVMNIPKLSKDLFKVRTILPTSLKSHLIVFLLLVYDAH